MSRAIYIKFDGSSRAHTGLATASCVIYLKDKVSPIRIRRERIRVKTSGEAEQMGFILGIDTLISHLDCIQSQYSDVDKCRIYGDSQVLFRHLRGKTIPRSSSTAFLTAVASKGLNILRALGLECEMYWVPRKCNLLADILCRTAYCFSEPSLTYSTPSYLHRHRDK
jgi:ribonuclease HI